MNFDLDPHGSTTTVPAHPHALPLLPFDASWLGIAQAAALVLVALAVAFIALRQWQPSKARLKLDLFEKRWDVYRAAVVYMSRITQVGPPGEPEVQAFSDAIAGANFLFDDHIQDIVRDVLQRGSRLTVEANEARRLEGSLRMEAELKLSEELDWFRSRLATLDQPFAPFLHLRH